MFRREDCGLSPHYKRVSFPGVHSTSDSHKRSRWMMIRDLYRCTHANFSWEHLDRTFMQNAVITRSMVPDSQSKRDDVVNCTAALLKRLPPTPLPLPSDILQPTEELIGGCWLKSDAGNEYSWDQLSTVSRLSSSVIRMGIAIALTYDRKADLNVSSSESHDFRQFLDFVSDLIDGVFFELEKGPVKKNDTWVNSTWRWFALLTYLWSTWQRCLALHYWRVLQDSLQTGFDYTGFGELGLRPNRGSFLALELQQKVRSQDKLQYMCNLAFQILQRSRSTSLLDLRHFHQRFIQVFGERPARCVGNRVCSGLGPDHCKRIRGGDKIEDQSQHDLSCTRKQGCSRMVWNKASYLEVCGPRAVSISSSSDQLCYKLADAKTLAISHVWLHGQGGIPDEHVLRKEAISTINQVFSTSHATILCDRDLMDIDISIIQDTDNTPASVALQESILSIVLVCDWNVRAWTLLEALRGRKNIQLLCKSGNENKLISLTEILRTVAFCGDITISILLLTNHHLFPPPNATHWIKVKTSNQELSKFQHIIFDASFDASIVSARIDRGFVAVSEAASLLGQRFASRPGDDVIIWSLLVDDPVVTDAQDLWARGKYGGARLDSVVHTGHLLSSVQRLTSRQGPSWAPRQPGPYPAANEEPPASKLYPPYDGIQSQIGLIEIGKNGDAYLRANWGVAVIHFKDGFASHYRSFQSTANCLVDETVPDQLKEHLKGYKEGILLQPLQREAAQGEGYGGISEGLVFAVCGKKYQKPGDGIWTWLGIIDWGKDYRLPYFEEREIILD
ncbi:uncharacterized protein F4807DRAFT_453032 [Annulohypoxylon truncatum]|uniref:uncharacterized protein n=1 Tax=Annulohypoxylon truncatum TaxID=327061 RepID=UPI002007C810|nr:uncharacterized protein F4807DRAFT_453032 [Annulohypoxylon truncatum]KAI1207223.1 hypothetical protein F4807DRAFT_453032 [Annulohypoxylon truncatum]